MKKIILFILFLCANIGFSQFDFKFRFEHLNGSPLATTNNYQYPNIPNLCLINVDLSQSVCEGQSIKIVNLSSGSYMGYNITGNTLWDARWGSWTSQPTSWNTISSLPFNDQQWNNTQTITIPSNPPSGNAYMNSGNDPNYSYYHLFVAPNSLGGHYGGVYNSNAGCSRILVLKLKVKKAPKCLSNLKVCDDNLLTNQILGINPSTIVTNWSPSDPRINNPVEGNYTVTLSNGNCSVNCSFNIEFTNPFQDLILDQTLCSSDLPYLSEFIYDSYPYSISVNGVIVFDQYTITNPSYFDQSQYYLQFTNSGNYQVVLNYYQDSNGSSSNCSKTYNLNISSPINFNHMPSNFIICDNSLDICGPLPPTGSTYTYAWYGPSTTGNQSILLSTEQCFIPQTNGGYNLVVTNENGCTGSHAFTVTNQLPTVELGHDIIICDGDYHSIPIISISNQGFDNGNFEITWYQNGIAIQNGGTVLQITPTGGTISVVITSPGSGCHSQIDQIEIINKICCPEEVNIGIIMCPGQAPLFHILNQGYDTGGYVITWYFNGNVIQNGGEILQLSLYGNGILSVTVEKEGCENKASDQISISCDKDVHPPHGKEIEKELKESTTNNNLNIYPNPTSDIVNFMFEKSETGKIEIYSLEGKLVFSKEFKEINQIEASLSDYQDGIYITRITTSDNTITKKIIKE